MKKILVPTDFSKTSLDAFRYALEWARIVGGSVHVLHVYTGTFDPNEALVVSQEARQERMEKEMDHFIHSWDDEEAEVGKLPVPVSRESRLGFATDVLRDVSGEYDWIVMGSTGRSGLLDKVLGTVSSYVSRHAECPVIMVPKGVRFQKIDHILYAANLQSIEEDLLQDILVLSADLEASLHFVHVARESDNPSPIVEKLFDELLQKKQISKEYYISTIVEEDVVDGLRNYQEANDIDMYVVVAQRRSFWDAILHKSLTKRLALSPKNVPCMVLHLKD